MQNQNITIPIRGIDEYSGPAEKIVKQSNRLTKALSRGITEMDRLKNSSKNISNFQKLEKQLGKTASEVDVTRKGLINLGREIKAQEKPNKKLLKEYEAQEAKLSRLNNKHRDQKQRLAEVRQSLRDAGYEGRNFARSQDLIQRKLAETNDRMKKMAKYSAELKHAQSKYDKAMQRSANMTIVGYGAMSVGRQVKNIFTSPVQEMRNIEKARGELSSVGVKNTGVVAQKGFDISSKYANITAADFVRAAYDIKSGISNLTDSGVANMTASAALTAKATKSDVPQMTSLFATAYGSFKKTLFRGETDSRFGDIFSAQLAKSVQSFKTDGGKMQQSIEAMGSGLAASGISMSQQLTGLGMLQQKMTAGESGTTLKALERSAGTAQDKLQKMGYNVNTLDANGNMKSLPDLLESMQKIFGKNYTTETGAKLLKAFGSDEAVKFFKALWGQQDAFRANTKALQEAGQQGMKFTKSMANLIDNNWDSRLEILSGKFENLKAKIGYALVPVIDRLSKGLGWLLDRGSEFVDKYPDLTSVAVTGVTVVGGLAAAMGSAMIATAMWTATIGRASLMLKKQALENKISSLGMGGGKRGRGMIGKFGGMGKVGTGIAMVGAGGLMAYDTLSNSRLSSSQKAHDVTAIAGGMGGALAGAQAGAILGTAILPGIGTAIGGLLGGMAGGWAGNGLGDTLGKYVAKAFGDSPIEQKAQAQLATKQQTNSGGAPAVDQRQYHFTVHQQPGEDAEAFAHRVAQIHRDEHLRSEYDVR